MSKKTTYPNILALIPARGGSKSVPRKNIRLLDGVPLIAWSIRAAQMCKTINRIIVSTDNNEIATIAQHWGAEVPFLRPAELAQDDTLDLPVYQHTLSWLAIHEKYYPDVVVWLRPTVPLRSVEDIENATDLLMATNADWVRSVCPIEHHPYWTMKLEENSLTPFIDGIDVSQYLQRQLLPSAYRLNGAVDVAWRKTIVEKQLPYTGDVRGYIMPLERSVDIDTEFDFRIAELLVKKGL